VLYACVKKVARVIWRWAFISDISFAYVCYAALRHLGHGGSLSAALNAAPVLERTVFLGVAIVIADFCTFFSHYLEHKVALLWQFHKVHHSALTLIPMTNLRFHPVQEVWDALWSSAGLGAWIALFAYFTSSPLVDTTILGINAILVVTCFSFHQLRHSHIYMRYPRWLERFVMSPAQHQIHHSCDERHLDRNFGLLLSCWDQLFGTIVYSEPAPATNLGLGTDQERYMTVWSLFAMPFVELGRKAVSSIATPAKRRLPRLGETRSLMLADGSSVLGRANAWKSRAEELRSLADTLGSPDARSGTLRAAIAYERLAEEAQSGARHPPRREAG
jgi:sterol desaturase/sphingolipid hydroxylase (fatty acid hydroxylase superfamily)